MALFDRRYELIVGESGSKGVSIKDLHISFAIEKTASSTPNQSTVRVWNMRPETRRIVSKVNNAVILKAGYDQDVGPQTIFIGIVTRSTTVREGSDWITELQMADGMFAYRDAKASLNFPAGSLAATVVAGIAEKFELPMKPMPAGVKKTYPHGFSFVGRIRDAMNKACDYAGLEWSIIDQEIQVIKKGGILGVKTTVKKQRNRDLEIKRIKDKELEVNKLISQGDQAKAEGNEELSLSLYKKAKQKNDEVGVMLDELKEKDEAEKRGDTSSIIGPKAIYLTPDTGMLGSPQPEQKTMSEKKAAKEGLDVDSAGVSVKKTTISKSKKKVHRTLSVEGYTVNSLLQPSIIPGGYVKIKSASIDNEFFRVESVKHTGDSNGQEWNTSMVLRFI